MVKKERPIDEFIKTARLCAHHSLVLCSSGNLSCRINRNEMMITSAGSWMSELSPKDIVTCDIKHGKIIHGKIKPSSETGLHRMIYLKNDKNKAILHFQSEFATAVACNKKLSSINFNVIPEIPFYIDDIGVVPPLKPGSIELAEAVAEQSKNHRVIIMQNHGIVAIGNNLKHVLQIGVFFELCCKIILVNGNNISTIPPSITRYLKEQSSFV
jgi:ribulose-5-phosphate 4-epimerase/fuculose-1-phosphate aldolase